MEEDSALRHRGSPKKQEYDDDIEDISGDSHRSSEFSGSFSKQKGRDLYPDPIADRLLEIYKSMKLKEYEFVKYGLIAFPFTIITLFYIFVSQSTSSVISFTAWNMSIFFVFVSLWILCEIL